MKKIKKSLCLVLTFLMIFSSCIVFSSAAEEKSVYVPDYDTETPVIIVHGMSQNNTYLCDENGEWAKDADGNYIYGWPLHIEFSALLKAVPALLKSIITRQDAGLSDALYTAAHEALYVIEKDNEGNYVNNVDVPCYECPMSELPESVKEEYYNFLPIQELGELIGEDNVYYFGYDSLGDVVSTADRLYNYIHNVVLPQTGAEQIKICPISLGGTVATYYLNEHPEDYSLIKKMVFVVPAIDGSNIIGDLLTNNLSVYDDKELYSNILVALLGETPLAYALNIVLRILPSNVLKSALNGLVNGVVDIAALRSPIIWALCPTAYYEEARAIWLENDELSVIREKADAFQEARANFEDNLFKLKATGAELFDVACYDVALFPLCKDYQKTNADRVIHAASPSMGATFADLGTTLGEGYEAAGTYCDDPTHNHLSPDGVVDATTGLLPCTTWYFKAQAHEQLPLNDVALELAIHAMVDDNIKDVYSNPAYPQFNNGRLTDKTTLYVKTWEEADKSKVSAADKAAIEAAIAEVKALDDETIVDIDAWKNAESALGDALYAAGLIENPNPTFLDKALTTFAKAANKCVNIAFEKFIKE